MKDKTKYTREIHLKYNEIPAKVNIETGELTELVDKDSIKTNPEMETFTTEFLFQRTNTEAWKLLRTQTTDTEFRIAFELALRAKAFTNSLQPLDDNTTTVELAEEFGIRRQDANKLFKKLFDLGVYGRFEVTEQDKAFKKYWVFNPYLAFNGRAINTNTKNLFSNTTYARVMRNR